MLIAIQASDVNIVWDVVAPILEKAVTKSQLDYTLQDIHDLLLTRDMQLWGYVKDDKIVACCVSVIAVYPQRKVCQLPYIAGIDMRSWLRYEEAVIAWARAQGCTKLEGYAREGWLRVLKDWKAVWITIRKDI